MLFVNPVGLTIKYSNSSSISDRLAECLPRTCRGHCDALLGEDWEAGTSGVAEEGLHSYLKGQAHQKMTYFKLFVHIDHQNSIQKTFMSTHKIVCPHTFLHFCMQIIF